MIDYLVIYLAIGLVVIGGQITHRLRDKPPLTWEQVVREPWTWIAGVFIFTSLWPLIPAMHLSKWLEKRREDGRPTRTPVDRPVFSVKPDDLVRQTSIEAVEVAERIQDPRRAVPDLPFGHLNKVWVSFIQMPHPTDELWAFEADWRPEHEIPRNFRGYAFVRDGVIVKQLVTRIREIDRA